MKSKTIILSSNKNFESNSPRAILTLISENNYMDGKIRLYNMKELKREVKLGIYYNNEVISSNLMKDRDAYNFKLNKNIDLSKDLYCALVDTSNKNDIILSGGNDLGFCFTDEEDENEEQKIITTNNKVYECDKDCKNCVYKEFFYQHHDEIINKPALEENCNQDLTTIIDDGKKTIDQEYEEDCKIIEDDYNGLFDNECFDYEKFELEQNTNQISSTNNLSSELKNDNSSNLTSANQNNKEFSINSKTENNDAEQFISAIAEQLDEMFLSYPIDEEIMSIIPNSKVVKVHDNLDNSDYIVGVIYENDKIQYLMYGVPAKYNSPVPAELGENYQWLALNTEDPMSDGYYLIYQDASSGKLIPIKIE